jgi:outer membrane protein assembly factor BamB
LDDVYVYIGNLKGNIYKLEKSSGKIIWEISTDGVLNITPILFKNRLIQPDLNKKIYFIDVESGKIVKVIETDNRPTLSPIYFDGTLFLGTDYGQIFAYEFVK